MASQTRILVGIGVGGTLGLLANVLQPRLSPEQQGYVEGLISNVADPLGQLFLRLLFMLVVPLLFAAVVMGVCELDLKNLGRSEEHTSELQSRENLVCRLLLEKKQNKR